MGRSRSCGCGSEANVRRAASHQETDVRCDWNRPRVYGAPGEIRTPDLRLRRPMLYPAELRARVAEAEFVDRSAPRPPFYPKQEPPLQAQSFSTYSRTSLRPSPVRIS